MEDLLKIYDAEVRANPVYPDVIPIIHNKHFVKLEGPLDFISYWDIPEKNATQIVHKEIAYYKQHNKRLMWRVFDHDLPVNLENLLQDAGLKIAEIVTLMALAIDENEPEETDLDIRELTEATQLHDFLTVTEAAFGEPSPVDFTHHAKLLTYPNFKYYVAYDDDIPVATARFEIADNSRFGLFFGGCVIPEYRGKDFYKALVSSRYTEAKRLGLKYLTTEARESSRPILEKLGFKPLAKGRTWELISNT